MKVLHTSDWHLGQRLLQLERQEEFAQALDWLLETIRQEEVDVLLVAGDIFDIGNPPNQARQLYYNFLRQLLNTRCQHVVITGGNHDSPAMLNAPRELLQAFNIHIIGAATDNLQDELLVLQNHDGQPALVVAAVPFLRDRDLRTTLAGENFDDRNARLQAGLTQHYHQLAALCQPFQQQGIPILAMGHLYAKGAVAAERQDNIYIGNRENMEAEHFPDTFDYVALGHIHRAQMVGQCEHIRYAGSLMPLSFSETADDKQVLILTFSPDKTLTIRPVEVPVFRRLKTITGTLTEVQDALARFAAKADTRLLTPWVEVVVDATDYQPQLDTLLREYCESLPLELVKIRIQRPLADGDALRSVAVPDLEDLHVEDVFLQRCVSMGITNEIDQQELLATFRELQNEMADADS
ncbi:MAG: exonuclease SbcCD subunit D C-terminal domain-containing protein [Saprospiraceae bacterium]